MRRGHVKSDHVKSDHVKSELEPQHKRRPVRSCLDVAVRGPTWEFRLLHLIQAMMQAL